MRPFRSAALFLLIAVLSTGAAKPIPTTFAIAQAQCHGINYSSLYTAALNHKESIPPFLALESANIFDGAGSDDYCSDLARLLAKHGDKVFAQAMNAFSEPTKQAIRDNLEYGSPRYHQSNPYTSGRSPLPSKTYTVIKGDTLERIATRLRPVDVQKTVQQLVILNHIQSPNAIREGATLILP